MAAIQGASIRLFTITTVKVPLLGASEPPRHVLQRTMQVVLGATLHLPGDVPGEVSSSKLAGQVPRQALGIQLQD
jgi:hypothetical protein